ncbi:hypothetical protein F7725_027140, partial [Dissostichus mawsoni]
MSSIAEHCLPSLLRTLFDWYRRQSGTEDVLRVQTQVQHQVQGRRAASGQRLPAGAEGFSHRFHFCLVSVEVLKQ